MIAQSKNNWEQNILLMYLKIEIIKIKTIKQYNFSILTIYELEHQSIIQKYLGRAA